MAMIDLQISQHLARMFFLMSNGLNQPLPQECLKLHDQGRKRCREHLGAHFLIVPFSSTVPSSIPYFLMTLRSWSMSNSSVASLPANIMMDFFPPGCSPESHPSWSTLVQNWCKTCNFVESLRVLMYASRPTSLSNQTRSMWQQFGKIILYK